jgi:hypothetical protein
MDTFFLWFFIPVVLVMVMGAVIYFRRSAKLERMKSGRDVLVHWRYDDGGEAIISITTSGAYVDGKFHEWTVMGTALDGAELVSEGADCGSVLEITYRSMPGPYSPFLTVKTKLRVPVPRGQEATALEVVDRLRAETPAETLQRQEQEVGVKFASVGARAAALLVDTIVCFVVLIIISSLPYGMLYDLEHALGNYAPYYNEVEGAFSYSSY